MSRMALADLRDAAGAGKPAVGSRTRIASRDCVRLPVTIPASTPELA